MSFFEKKATVTDLAHLKECVTVLATEIGYLRSELTDAIEKNVKLQQEVSVLNAVSADTLERHKLKTSDDPWIDIIGSDVDPTKGLQLTMDWNDAFIEQLRAQGYKGTTEQALVAQYLLVLSNNMKGEDK